MFLSITSGNDDENRIIAFGNRELLAQLEHAEIWLGDGTFGVSPRIFFQLNTLHGRVGTSYPPLVYFLLPNKTQRTYEEC